MRVLILNEYFYPGVAATAQQSADLAQALARKGHEVVVVTGRRGYDAREKPLRRRETWNGVRVFRVASLGLGKSSRWQRAAHFASFLAAAAWRLLWLRRCDLVIGMTTPPLISFLAALFARAKGGRLCVWVMDLNPDQAVAAGWLAPGGRVHRILERLLRYSLLRAEKVVVLDHFMRDRIVAKGVRPEAVATLPPWSRDGSNRYDEAGRAEFRARHGLEGKFVVMYAGNHSPCHPLDTLLEAAEKIQLKPDGSHIALTFVGGGSELDKVKRFVRTRNLRNVICLPYQPMKNLAGALSAADMHAVVMGDPFVGIVHPCKIYNILSLGVPFLYIGPAPSHITEMLPPGAAESWASLARHGNSWEVAEYIRRCARQGARRFEGEMVLAGNFSSQQILPRLVALFEGAGQRIPTKQASPPGQGTFGELISGTPRNDGRTEIPDPQ